MIKHTVYNTHWERFAVIVQNEGTIAKIEQELQLKFGCPCGNKFGEIGKLLVLPAFGCYSLEWPVTIIAYEQRYGSYLAAARTRACTEIHIILIKNNTE